MSYSFVNRQRQYQLVVVRTNFNLVQQPLFFLGFLILKLNGVYVVDCEGYFLILVELVIIMVRQVGTLFGGNYPFHKFYGGIVFPAVFSAFCLYGYFLQPFCFGL